jgi:DNA polymerase-3 subunit beta
MKFTCPKNTLVQAIQIVSKAVSSKPQMPILSGIYFNANENILELQATDYELGIACKIEAQIDEPGAIVLSGRYMQEVIRRLPGEEVRLEFNREEKIVNITSNTADFTLLSLPANEFPVIQPMTGNMNFTIRDNVLRDLVKKTVFSCSNDEARPVFTGCLLDVNNSEVTMAATNTHRLSVKKEILDEFNGSIKIIIPAKVLNELLRIMVSEIPTNVKVNCSYNQISFSFDNVYLTSRLIEGQFPDYKRVIPPEFTTNVKIHTHDFLSAVDRVSLISRAGEYNIIRLNFSEGKVLISSNNPDIGKAEETVPASIDGPDVTIAFNAKYVTDVLKNIDGEEFYFSLNQSLNPAAVKQENDDTFTYIVTPVRTAQ